MFAPKVDATCQQDEQLLNDKVVGNMHILTCSIRVLEEHVKTLTKTLVEQGTFIEDLKAQLNHLSNCINLSTGTVESQGMKADVTPVSGVPLSVDSDLKDTTDIPNARKASRRRCTASSIEDDDCSYIPQETLSESSAEEGFKWRRNKKKRQTMHSIKKTPIQKKLFTAPKKGKATLKGKSEDIIVTGIARPYGIPFVDLLDISPIKHGDELPKWMKVKFRPTKEMIFVGAELAVAAYIFGATYDPKELLVPNIHCCGNREAFMTLVPGRPLVDDVLILLASMLTHGSIGHKWFLPTTFAQIALQKNPVSDGTLRSIRRDFMGKLDKVIKIYVPMHRDHHWFLMIIDLMKEELIYLDSMKSNEQRTPRIEDMQKVAVFIEKLVRDDSFYIDTTQPRPAISTYPIIEPTVSQQHYASNDCGIWVAQWMMLSPLWSKYDFGRVNAYTRMRLAIDLCLKDYNPQRDVLKKKAIQSWNRHQYGPNKRR